MSSNLIWIPCKLKRDSQGVYCHDCDAIIGCLEMNPYWHWSKTKWMHESGSGHKVSYAKLELKQNVTTETPAF
jgi:hypothetical protein